jgi:hypothetical protein
MHAPSTALAQPATRLTESPQYSASTQGSIVPAPQQFLTAVERPRCSRCRARMMLERVSPGPIGFERRLFECPRCDQVETSLVALDPFNPMRPVGPPANSERKTE